MKQLNSVEHIFLDLEAGHFSLDVSTLHLYDPSTAPGGVVTFDEVFERFAAGIPEVPVLRRKLVTVPLGLDHPYWIDDPAFDLANHLEHIELPEPGTWDQLMAVVVEQFSRGMRRDRPLWFGAVITGIHGVEGLPENAYALFLKMHHAAIDGASGRRIQQAIHDLAPAGLDQARARRGEARTRRRRREPSRAGLLARALPNHVSKAVRSVGALARTTPRLASEVAGSVFGTLSRPRSLLADDGPLRLLRMPDTVFNPKDSGPGLRIDSRVFPLAEIKAIRALVPGSTVNDVVFAIISGAMGRYLEEIDERPAVPLTSGMPVDLRTEDDDGATVMITILLSKLFTHIDDPVERLAATHASNRGHKDSFVVRTARPVVEVLERAPHLVTAPFVRNLARAANWSNVLAMHTLITNVPGIPVPLYLAGGRMVGLLGILPIGGRTAITHAVFSTPETLSITMTCGAAVMPDTERYMTCLQATFDEYRALLEEGAD